MSTYLLEIYDKEVTVDYDEVKRLLIVDDTRKIVLKTSEAHMLDLLETNFNEKMSDESWDKLTFWLLAVVKFHIKRI